MSHPIKAPKKLIEVALPLDTINAAAAREKSIRHGHPSTLHLWWSRKPLAAARAVIFAQLVNDPSWKWELEHTGEIAPNHLKATWAAKRKQLFRILEDLVEWENTTNEAVLERARAEIRKSWKETCEANKHHPQAAQLFNPDKLPGLHDPFAGGGTIPLEAQRLGLEAYASDLNPVAVLINKAMIEIPPKFAGRPPISKAVPARAKSAGARKGADLPGLSAWPGATGLIEDLRYYGAWMRAEAERRIGHLYPPIEITKDMTKVRPDLKPYVGQKLTVIAWLWARTVKSPNPAFRHVDVPLASKFVLSSKAGKGAWVEPIVKGDTYSFEVRMGDPPEYAKVGTKAAGRGANFRCLLSNAAISGDYIKAEGQAGRMGARLMAVVVEGTRTRVYVAPTPEMERAAVSANPTWRPTGDVPARLTGGTCVPYGLREWGDLFTPRQLVALTTFSDLVSDARERAKQDALAAGFSDDQRGLAAGGTGAAAYADAVSVYLGLGQSRLADISNALCRWEVTKTQVRNLFGQQSIPMMWDFAENNLFANAAGDFATSLGSLIKVLETSVYSTSRTPGEAWQADAQTQESGATEKIFSTDPPYYDNIGYADLSDFFYVWLRRSLRPVFPLLLATMAVPKAEELVATPYRHGSRERAEAFFLDGMTAAMRSLAVQAHPSAPITIYYAFKQSETKSESGTTSTGWETFLEAVHRAGLALTGTWPMRTELTNRMSGQDTNALASSIVLVCRQRLAQAPSTSRRAFQRELNQALPFALDEMTKGTGDSQLGVAPVDLSQAIIGPGMAIFSKYAEVLEADGSPMSVKTALQLINRFLAEDDFDHDTQFCLHWFEQHGWQEGFFGDADVLARAKATAVGALAQAGVIKSGGGKVRLLRPSEYRPEWDPAEDNRVPVWEVLHRLIRAFRTGGEAAAGAVLGDNAVYGKVEAARQLAFRLYTLCERRGFADDARAYNEIVTSWDAIEAASARPTAAAQGKLI